MKTNQTHLTKMELIIARINESNARRSEFKAMATKEHIADFDAKELEMRHKFEVQS